MARNYLQWENKDSHHKLATFFDGTNMMDNSPPQWRDQIAYTSQVLLHASCNIYPETNLRGIRMF